MIEAMVFDMDGLLFDTERIVQRSWNRAGEVLGYGPMGEQIYHTLGFNVVRREQYFKKLYGQDFPMEKFSPLTRKFFYEIADAEGISMKPGVRELLIYAKAHGIKTALATSSREAHARSLLEEQGIWKYFDGAVYGDMVEHAKPNPEIYQKACAMIGVNPSKSIALEDAPAGIRAAHAAGMLPVMIPDLVQPDSEIRTLCWKQFGSLMDVLGILELREI
ncbi:MAG: HAD family phosphatase [Hespellia sp.]|nr:HAD family phosphatase [Hespellia sp.]